MAGIPATPSSLDGLIEALRCLPGVGPKAAQRMAYHLLSRVRRPVHSVLDETYWSGSAFGLGPGVMRFLVRPCAPHGAASTRSTVTPRAASARDSAAGSRVDAQILNTGKSPFH